MHGRSYGNRETAAEGDGRHEKLAASSQPNYTDGVPWGDATSRTEFVAEIDDIPIPEADMTTVTNTSHRSRFKSASGVDRRSEHRRQSQRSEWRLSIVMPAYNERRTIAAAVAAVLSAQYPCDFELIVVDDGSTDGTTDILRALEHPKARVVTHPLNFGKGAALQTGAFLANGTHLVPFDSDLEYDPGDLAAMMAPIMGRRCEAVYGARLLGANTRYQSYRHAVGNKALTLAANVMFDSSLSDIHTCLKLVSLPLFRELELSENGFGLDTEITAKLLARGIQPFEVPVSYHSRSVGHGKKIGWRDGVECLKVLAQVRSGRKLSAPAPPATDDPLESLEASVTLLEQISHRDPHDHSGLRSPDANAA